MSVIRTTEAQRAVARFDPEIELVQGTYRLRFARSDADLEAAFRLRFQVFNEELGEGLEESWKTGLDRDRFDPWCNHVLVEDVSTDTVVGTYRFQVSEAAALGEGFYSATEFDLAPLGDEVLPNSIEMGRACIAAPHRSKKVLFLLWKGLLSYIRFNSRRYLFGCCSLTSQDPVEGAQTWAWLLESGHAHPELVVHPLAELRCVPPGDWDEVKHLQLPPLFEIYLRYGVVVCGPPAIDRVFGTIDFLAFLDLNWVDPRVLRTFS